MGTSSNSDPESELVNRRGSQIDAWLRGGGLVIASSERARRSITAQYHRARRAEGLAAWPAPEILDWQTFLRNTWRDRSRDDADRLLLNPAQEKSVWAGIAAVEQQLATSLPGPRNRIAALAMQGHQLLCSYAAKYLRSASRTAWQQDAAVFSGWLEKFEEGCAAGKLLSAARLPLELIEGLEGEPDSEKPARPPLLLAGFDMILPVQRRLLDMWGSWQLIPAGQPARETRFYRVADTQSELRACALWCKQKLAADTNAKLLVICQDLAQRRGEIERAFLTLENESRATPSFEFSLGVPLGEVALTHSAHLLLRWFSSPIDENEADWLFSSGFAVADAQETTALQSYMRALRQRGLERPHWSIPAFLSQSMSATLPANWVSRISQAQRRLNEQARSRKSPLEWAEFVPNLLQVIGWPGSRPLSSEEYQVIRRWEAALDSCAALGFDGRRIEWSEFLGSLSDVLDETVFAPETHDAPIQIAGPSESAGLSADAIWFMGASEDAWPTTGATHPFLPIEVQREASMPHAKPQIDWEIANSITTRLLGSAPEVCFSFARQGEDADARPSRLVVLAAGALRDLPPELIAPQSASPATVPFEDFSLIAFHGSQVEGGSRVLTYQSQCPFKAFATARLAARGWNAAEPCLTAAQRGQLLHGVLHSIWGGQRTGGIRTLAELRQLEDRKAFIAEHVARAMQKEIKRSVRERLPHRYLEMEERRLNSLIGEWLEFEMKRVEFTVLETEAERTVSLADLTFDVRLDRIDQLADGSLLVIDYKTGHVKTSSWELPRPDDVQLPLYASTALDPDETIGGLAFAEVRRGDSLGFSGYLKDARTTLISNLRGTSSLVKNKLNDDKVQDWRWYIEELVRDFLSGRAEVDPREYPKTCERCDLQAVCRIQEHHALTDAGGESEDGEEAGNE